MNDWHNLHITDKTGKKFFKVNASPMATDSEIKNLKRKLEWIKANNPEWIDSESAVLVLDGTVYSDLSDILDDDLLKELMS